MDPQTLRLALRPGDAVVAGDSLVRVARVGRASLVGVPVAGEPALVAVAYEDVEGVVVRELEGDVREATAESEARTE